MALWRDCEGNSRGSTVPPQGHYTDYQVMLVMRADEQPDGTFEGRPRSALSNRAVASGRTTIASVGNSGPRLRAAAILRGDLNFVYNCRQICDREKRRARRIQANLHLEGSGGGQKPRRRGISQSIRRMIGDRSLNIRRRRRESTGAGLFGRETVTGADSFQAIGDINKIVRSAGGAIRGESTGKGRKPCALAAKR